MALNSPAEVFLYELSGMYDAERKSRQLLSDASSQVQDGPVGQLLQTHIQEGQEKIDNLDACFQALGMTPQEIPCVTIDGMRAEFQAFTQQQPSIAAFEMYATDAAMKLSHFGVASYRGLVDKALLMGQSQCAQILQANLVGKEESSGVSERVAHDVGQRMMSRA